VRLAKSDVLAGLVRGVQSPTVAAAMHTDLRVSRWIEDLVEPANPGPARGAFAFLMVPRTAGF